MAELVADVFGVAQRLAVAVLGRGGDDGVAEALAQFARDGVFGNAQADRLLARLHDLGDEARRFEDEGEGAGREVAQDAVGEVGDLGVAGHFREVGDEKGHGLAAVASLDLVEAVDGALVEQVAAEAVIAVGGVGDEGAAREGLDGFVEEAWLRIDGVDLQDGSGHGGGAVPGAEKRRKTARENGNGGDVWRGRRRSGRGTCQS